MTSVLVPESAVPLPGIAELERIVGLATEPELGDEELAAVSAAELEPGAAVLGIKGLWRQQAAVLLSYRALGGAFGVLPVSGGKALASLLCVKEAWARGLRKIVLLVPSDLAGKAVERDLPLARRAIGFRCPVQLVHGLSPAARLHICRSGRKGLYLYTYALLSRPQAREELEGIAPELVVADEAHALRHVGGSSPGRSTTGERFAALMREQRPRFVALSGTMARDSLRDYLHLIKWALGRAVPVPLLPAVADLWIDLLSAKNREAFGRPEDGAALEPLREWAVREVQARRIPADRVGGALGPDPEGWRRAFKLRRDTAPGVISAPDFSVGCSLVVRDRTVPFVPEERLEGLRSDWSRRFPGTDEWVPADEFGLTEEEAFEEGEVAELSALERVAALSWAVDRRSTTPSGDVLMTPLEKHKWLTELSGGFYNESVWPDPEWLAEDRGVSLDEAAELLDRAREREGLYRAYRSAVRKFLGREHRPGVDSPLLVWNECEREGDRVPEGVLRAYRRAREADFDGCPEQLDRAVRVCDWKVRAAVEWVRERGLAESGGALVWAWNLELASWLHEELLRAYGPDRVIRCPAGDAGNRLIQDPASGGKLCVASLAHRQGRDLFHWSINLFVQFPRGAAVAEQAIGRTHRFGQAADEVEVWTMLGTEHDREVLAACRQDSAWLDQAEGRQRLARADWRDEPPDLPPDFLRARGFELLSRGGDEDAVLRAVLGVREGGSR